MHQCLYLHGFASGPASTKAKFFSSQLRTLGLTVHVPDLNGASFSDLTISSQLDICRMVINSEKESPFVVIGSSMGGLLATMLSREIPQVRALVLFAPGFGLNRRWKSLLNRDEVDAWKRRGAIDVFNYAAGRKLPLRYGFIEDAERYQTDGLSVAVPTLVMHGFRDEVVPYQESVDFQDANCAFVHLHGIHSDHALTDCLPQLWEIVHEFLQRHRLLESKH
jgi:uncharacterized protein